MRRRWVWDLELAVTGLPTGLTFPVSEFTTTLAIQFHYLPSECLVRYRLQRNWDQKLWHLIPALAGIFLSIAGRE